MNNADTKPESRPGETNSIISINPSTAEGRSRAVLLGGMGWLALGSFLKMSFVFWGGVLIVSLAFLVNTAGKFVHYRELPITRGDRLKLTASWTLLSLTVLALILNYAITRYGPGNGDYFWSLAVAGIGFGLLHMAAQSMYLPNTAIEGDT